MNAVAKLSKHVGSGEKGFKKYLLLFSFFLFIQQLQAQYTAASKKSFFPAEQKSFVAGRSGYRFLPNQISPHWGVFCVYERKLQQTTRIPLFIRLGSLEEVRRLERSGLR